MAQIVATDPIAEEGLELLREAGHQVTTIALSDLAGTPPAAVVGAEAWLVRSGTQLTADLLALAPHLRAVGRAGVGTDNVDLKTATERGIAVFHAPTGNITSAAEQAWALMLAAARRTCEADASMKQELWRRKELKGVELHGKTLFIVGLGRIGAMMAKRAQAFGMMCIGYDPFITPDVARAMNVETVSLETGMSRADFVTLHTPLTDQTVGLIGTSLLSIAKPGTIIVNAARGGLIDPPALIKALDNGTVAAAGIDVWPDEPPTDWSLAKHAKVVAAPHLGASTAEAQTKAALQACERVRDFLATGDAGLAVNAQAQVPDQVRPWAELAQAMAGFIAQAMPEPIEEVVVAASGDVAAEALQVYALVGALSAGRDDASINAINAPGLAKEHGWARSVQTIPDSESYVRVALRSAKTTRVIEGTWTSHYGARVSSLDGYDVEFRPRGRFLYTRHHDQPGVLAAITACLAEAGVNVASVALARRKEEAKAIAVIRVDGPIPSSARDALRAIKTVEQAHRIRLA